MAKQKMLIETGVKITKALEKALEAYVEDRDAHKAATTALIASKTKAVELVEKGSLKLNDKGVIDFTGNGFPLVFKPGELSKGSFKSKAVAEDDE